MNNYNNEFIETFSVLHHNKLSKIFSFDQDRDIKRYFMSQIRSSEEKSSFLDNAITDSKAKTCHDKIIQDDDEHLFHGYNLLLNVEFQ